MKMILSQSRRAFTLIELLVVIAIIAILMGLLIPTVSSVLENARRAQAKNDVTQIATAVIAYETEYGKLPSGSPSTVSQPLLRTLAGQDPTGNPRGIVFLEVPNAKGGKNGATGEGTIGSGYKDSWGQDYNIAVDDDYNNQVAGPNGIVRKRVAVWSQGNTAKSNAKAVYSWE